MDHQQIDSSYHTPVLLTEAIEGLDIKSYGIYADATFGGGGHSRAIIAKLSSRGHLYGFDQDLDAYANNIDDPRFTFVRSNFEYMPNFLRFYGVSSLDGILADLGVSSHHFDDAQRGFSFREEAPLDMRMNRDSLLTASQIVNECSMEWLRTCFIIGSDLSNPQRWAEAIVKSREKKPILTTMDFVDSIRHLLNPKTEKKDLAQAFQALRIAVNDERNVLCTFLENCSRMLRRGGRLAIITYHSHEDRLVKNLMKTGNLEGEVEKDFYGNISSPWKMITRSPITPSAEEIERNPRARSAKLRIAEKI